MVQVQDWGSGYLPGAGSKLGILGRDEVPESKNKGFLIKNEAPPTRTARRLQFWEMTPALNTIITFRIVLEWLT